MKKILFVLSLFVSAFGFGQNVHTNDVSRKQGTDSILYNTNSINAFAGHDTLLGVKTVAQNYITIDSSVQVGSIYDSSTWNNIDPGVFTKTGTVTVTSNKITMPTGTNSIQWVTSTCFDQETFQVDLKMTALTANDSFPQIGWTSTNTAPIPAISMYISYSKATNTLEMWQVTAGSRGVTFSSSALTGGVSVNDNLSFVFDRDVDGIGTTTATLTNTTTGNSVSISTNINPFLQSNTTSGILRNTGAFSITGRGATTNTVTINRIYYYSKAPKFPKAVVLGYSIDYGSWAGLFQNRYAALAHMVNWGGASDASQSGVRSMTALYTYMKPKNVFITLVGNDIFYGVSSGTWQANLTAIHDTLVAHGINVVFLDPSPRTATDMTPGKTWIEANYPSGFINTFTPLLGSGTTLNATYDGGDGVHLNPAGHALFASTIRASTIYQAIAGSNYVRYYAPSDYVNPSSGVVDSLAFATLRDVYRNVAVPLTAAGSTGDIQYKGANGTLSTAPSSILHYDSTNQRLGIGIASPRWQLDMGTAASLNGPSFSTGDVYFQTPTTPGGNSFIYYNAYNNGSNYIYAKNGAAAIIGFLPAGGYYMRSAVAGTAGATITWVQNIYWRSDGSGALGIDAGSIVPLAWTDFSKSTTAHASFNIPTATAAPSSPNTGDVWQDGTNFKVNALNITPVTTSAKDLGTTSLRWNNLFSTNINNSGSEIHGYRAITALRTLDATDHIVNCTANSFTVTLPTAVGITGREYIIKNTGSSTTITIATTSSQTIDGSAPGTVTTLVPLRVVSDGANWITF